MLGKVADRLTERWRLLVLLGWVAMAAWLIFERWNNIRWFALGDTDDNLRMAQVRALIAGQDWFDLRQYKLNPPFGADIHWSRLVDLPFAGLILLFRPLVGGAEAELASTGLPAEQARHYASRMAAGGAAGPAIGWYRAMPFQARDRVGTLNGLTPDIGANYDDPEELLR